MSKIQFIIDESFSKKDENLKDFHVSVMKNLSETEKKLANSTNQLIFYLFAYLLIVQSSVNTINLGIIKVDNLDLIIKFFPVILVYKIYSFINLQVFRRSLHLACNGTIKKLYPKIYKNNLLYLIKAESNVNTQELFEEINSDGISKLMGSIGITILGIQLVFIPGLIVLYALYINFSKFGIKDFLIWIVLLIVVVYLIMTILILISNERSNNFIPSANKVPPT